MPSGSKRRKAAKKKKEKESSSNSNPHPLHQGDDDPKLDEEKESDGGETNSPLSQDHHNNQHFAEEENKREEDASSIGLNGNGDSSNKVEVVQTSKTQVTREIELEDDSKTIEQVVFKNKKSSSSSSSSSSRSSSDDESKFPDKKIEIITWEEPVVEASSAVDLGEISDLPENTRANEAILHSLPFVPSKDESFEAVSAEGSLDIPSKPTNLPEITIEEVAKSEGKASNLVSESIYEIESVVLYKDEDLGTKANVKSESLRVLSTTKNEDSEITSVAIEEENKIAPQSNVQVAESLDQKTPVALPSRPVQASSMGCCGLFELFRSSGR